ncbi:MAG: FkbM family methyltransferase [Thalassobaculaceae bacterium]|nr:FkbM family methyltransferase [Thalassobaculaceae bacterium]
MTHHPNLNDHRRAVLRSPGDSGAYLERIYDVFSLFDPDDLARLTRRADVLRGLQRGKSLESHTADHMVLGRSQRRFVASRSNAVRDVDVDGHRLRFLAGRGPENRFFVTAMPEGKIHEIGVIRLLAARMKPEELFLDIGAHIGYISCFAAHFGATVLAMEMQPTLLPVISANAILNGLWRIHPILAAAGETVGLVQSMRVVASPGLMTFSERLDGDVVPTSSLNHDIVPRLRIDDFCFDRGDIPAWVKVDVEGAEGPVLAGAKDLIAQRRTRFLVELHSHRYKSFGTTAQGMLDLFAPEHWRVGMIRDDGSVEPMTRAQFLAHDSTADDRQTIFEPVDL